MDLGCYPASLLRLDAEGESMVGKTLTRADLSEAVRRAVGLSHTESADMLKQVIDELADVFVAGDPIKLSSFGTFAV